MRRRAASIITAGLVLSLTLPATAIIVNFEEAVGNDGVVINTQYDGITFESALSGTPWQYGDLSAPGHEYNASTWPSGQEWNGGEYWINGYGFAWTSDTGNDGKIGFNNQDASYVQVDYSAAYPFFLEAYNAAGDLVAVDQGPANLRYYNSNPNGMNTLRVDAPVGEEIAYVMVHDNANYWSLDNVITDATGINSPGDLQIMKFYDSDLDGYFDAGESLLAGWEYLVEGPDGFSQTVFTDQSGSVTLDELDPGSYTITEILQPGWNVTTDNPMVIDVVTGATAQAMFGNVPEPSTLALMAVGLIVALRRRS